MKRILLVIFTLCASAAWGQFQSASMEIDGLTCSMCQLGVQRSIQKLDFIQTVKVDLNTNVASIEFKSKTPVNIGQLVKSVFDAGFSVRTLTVDFNFSESAYQSNTHFIFNNSTYHILNSNEDKPLSGLQSIRFVEKQFTEPDVYNRFKKTIENKLSNNPIKDYQYFVLK